jgi:CheY-like chemotaxis protein
MNVQTLTPARRRDGFDFEPFAGTLEARHAPRILVAEDQESMRGFLIDVLAGHGYEVTSVSDGEQAWAALAQAPYDLLITDHEMPHLTGLQLIARIREAGWSLPAIVVSGSLALELASDFPQLHIAALERKPFGHSEFLETVSEALPTPWEDAAADPTADGQLHAHP